MGIKNNNQNFTTGYHILRVTLAITFIWIGVLIIKSPESWGGYLEPWAVSLLPVSIKTALLFTAVIDIIIGILFLIDWKTFWAGLIASIHLVIILVVSGITDITVRDIGLLGATLVVMIEDSSLWFRNLFKFTRSNNSPKAN